MPELEHHGMSSDVFRQTNTPLLPPDFRDQRGGSVSSASERCLSAHTLLFQAALPQFLLLFYNSAGRVPFKRISTMLFQKRAFFHLAAKYRASITRVTTLPLPLRESFIFIIIFLPNECGLCGGDSKGSNERFTR